MSCRCLVSCWPNVSTVTSTSRPPPGGHRQLRPVAVLFLADPMFQLSLQPRGHRLAATAWRPPPLNTGHCLVSCWPNLSTVTSTSIKQYQKRFSTAISIYPDVLRNFFDIQNYYYLFIFTRGWLQLYKKVKRLQCCCLLFIAIEKWPITVCC